MTKICLCVFIGSMDPLKKQLRLYLEEHGDMAPSRFADLAGVKRYSITRFLNEDDAGLLYPTRVKVSTYMVDHP